MAGSRKSWVTKTDVSRYVRCPYSYYLLYKGEVTFEETIDPFSQRLVAEGIAFQDGIEAKAPQIVVSPDQYPQLDLRILNTPTMQNDDLRIKGRPDGIDTAHGALFPIEIKSHQKVELLDELELAFYWLLLEPQRTRDDVTPRGLLILRRDGQPVPVEVEISERRIDRVLELIDEVRKVRRTGVEPQICRCNICGNLRRAEVRKSVAKRKHVSSLYGVGPKYSAALESMGHKTYPSLLKCDPVALSEAFKAAGHLSVSPKVVSTWQHHARSLHTAKPVLIEPVEVLDLDLGYIALDLEYDPIIWLIGLCVVEGDERVPMYLWANDRKQELANLLKLADVLNNYAGLPVVTWGGSGADLPRIRRAVKDHNIADRFASLDHLHRDLYQWANRNIRLPIPDLSIKSVGDYFGYPRISEGIDGFAAMFMYQQYVRTKKQALRDELLDYNRDDVDSLIHVVTSLQELTGGQSDH